MPCTLSSNAWKMAGRIYGIEHRVTYSAHTDPHIHTDVATTHTIDTKRGHTHKTDTHTYSVLDDMAILSNQSGLSRSKSYRNVTARGVAVSLWQEGRVHLHEKPLILGLIGENERV